MSSPASLPPAPRLPARSGATTKPAQKCLFQNENDWRALKSDGSDESRKAAEQANQMLKERLGGLLLSQNLLLLLGSGASVAVGGPSMQVLWNEAAELHKAVFEEVC